VRKSRFTEQQISYALKQAETGTPVAEVIRKMGITEQTFLPLEEAVWWNGRRRAA
jgi:putative transposase